LSFGGNFTLQDDVSDLEALDDKAADKKANSMLAQITHMCMDRPLPGATTDQSKEYVVPQYVVDSLNNLFLLPTKSYTPGKPSPAHLSPFVDNTREGYVPDRQREINVLAGVATEEVADDESSSEEEEIEVKPKAKNAKNVKGKKEEAVAEDEDMIGDGQEGESSDSDDSEDEQEQAAASGLSAA